MVSMELHFHELFAFDFLAYPPFQFYQISYANKHQVEKIKI